MAVPVNNTWKSSIAFASYNKNVILLFTVTEFSMAVVYDARRLPNSKRGYRVECIKSNNIISVICRV